MSSHRTLLLVEDEEKVRKLLAGLLTTHGWLVTAAASGDEALARLTESKFDIVLCARDLGRSPNGSSFLTARRQVQIERVPELLVFSLKPTVLELTTQDDGVDFDLDADGVPERIAWTVQGRADSFLAIDENHNGRIDDGSELVGAGVSGPPNGFDYLSLYDGWRSRPGRQHRKDQAKGHISGDDYIYKQLILWTDANHNGISEEDELESLAYAEISQIDLAIRQRLDMSNGRGSRLREVSAFARRAANGGNVHATRLAGARMPRHGRVR
jgi:CheY-like chemotaxis protein